MQQNPFPTTNRSERCRGKKSTFDGSHRGKRRGVHSDLRRHHVYPATTPLVLVMVRVAVLVRVTVLVWVAVVVRVDMPDNRLVIN